MFYDEEEFFTAVAAYEKAEKEANRVKEQVFSFERGKMPERSITDEDVAIMNKAHEAWDKIIEIARRPLPHK